MKEQVRRADSAADRYLLTKNVKRLFVQSRRFSAGSRVGPSCDRPVLPARAARMPLRRVGDYIFMASRLTPLKRSRPADPGARDAEGQGIRAVVAGDGEERERLAADRHARPRQPRDAGGASQRGSCSITSARCRAVCFPPRDGDYGFVTVEAFASRKPVVTCRDSGGPAELVRMD